MKIIQSPSFFKTVKKLKSNEKKILDNNIRKIVENPNIGIRKTGTLKDVFVYKFRMKTTQYLLAYEKQKNTIELIMLGPHENYYRDLKNYLE